MGVNLLFTIFAFVFFGTLLVFDNNLIIANQGLSAENEMSVVAFSAAQSIINEAKTKAFDQKVALSPTDVPDSTYMTPGDSLGPESAEFVPSPDTLTAAGFASAMRFNDVDDYNGYRRLATTSQTRADTLHLSVVVQYVTFANPDVPVAGAARSYLKRMTVSVSSAYIPRSYSFSHIFSY